MWKAPRESPVELGLLSVRIEPLLDGRHAALFALPGGFGLVTPGDTPSIEDPSVVLTVRPAAGNEFIGQLDVARLTARATFVIPIRSTILSAKSGDIEIAVTHLEGQFPSGAVVAGQVLPGEVTIGSSRVQSMTDGKSKVEIAFSENMAGLLGKGRPLKLTLPEGFGWANAHGALVSGEDYRARLVADGRTLELVTERESTRRATFRVEAEVRVTDVARAKSGEVRAGISGLDRVSPSTILVARYTAPEPPQLEPKPGPAPPAPAVPRTAVFAVGNDYYTSNGVTARMDAVPYLKDGRAHLPLRYVGLSLGAGVAWDGEARRATLTRQGTTVLVTLGSNTLLVNGRAVQMHVVPEVVPPGRIMLPYRFVAEAFGADVTWNPVTRTVTMTL